MEDNKDQNGAAVRGEAVAGIPSDETIWNAYLAILGRVEYFGKDDALAHAKVVFKAAAPVSARAADAPSEPSDDEIVAIARQAIRDGSAMWDHFTKDDAGKFTVPVLDPKDFMLVRAVLAAVKSSAADALDSQPTESESHDEAGSQSTKQVAKVYMDDNGKTGVVWLRGFRPERGMALCLAPYQDQQVTASQPQPARQSIGEDALIATVTAHCNDLADCAFALQEHGGFATTAQEILVAVTELRKACKDSRASAAPLTRIAELEEQLAECVALSQKWASAAGEADGRAHKAREAALDEAAGICMRATPDRDHVRRIGEAAHYVACSNAILRLKKIPAPQQEGSEAGNG